MMKNHFNDSHYGSLHVVLGNLLAFVSSLYTQTTTQLILASEILLLNSHLVFNTCNSDLCSQHAGFL